ncbi:MAG: GNAT family N-acetyltransferase [Bryobacterales bacterium]|nr:GNAT family N-acetyltransferase [Bryobacterales bacterium]
MDFRPYQTTDREGCLAVFDSNAPEFLHASERAGFAAFLDNPPGPYFVLEHDGSVAGCGGYAFETPDMASLCWILVRRDLHRNGLGRLLVFSALRKITQDGDPMMVRLHATPLTAAFFEKQGFRMMETAGDGVEMRKKLKVCP